MEIKQKLQEKILKLKKKFDYQNSIKVFIADNWTFEFALFRSNLFNNKVKEIIKAIYPDTDFTNFEDVLVDKLINQNLSKTEIAYRLSSCLEEINFTKEKIESDTSIQYLVEAIKFVCK